MKKTMMTALTLTTLNTFALGQIPDSFHFGPGSKLVCLNGPGVVTLNFEKVTGHSGFNKVEYQVSGSALWNIFGLEGGKFKTKLNVFNISTRAYWGQEISGEIEELQGEIKIDNHIWYSYINHDIPAHFQGTFDSYVTNQAYPLTCFPQK